MTYIEADVVRPISLVVPEHISGETIAKYIGVSGEIFMSGSKIWVNVDGSTVEVVTSG